MSAVVEAIGDAIGDVFEAVGDVVESVVDVVSDVVEFVGDTVQKVLDDPLPMLLQIGVEHLCQLKRNGKKVREVAMVDYSLGEMLNQLTKMQILETQLEIQLKLVFINQGRRYLEF